MKRALGGLLTILIFVLVSMATGEHPVYLSKAEIDYDQGANRLEIALELFPDDLSDALSKQEGRTIEIGTDFEADHATTYIHAYLKEHFKFKINGREKEFRYLGREIQEDRLTSLWVYLEVPHITRLKSLALRNSILIHHQEEQRNYVLFRENKKGKYKRHVATRGGEELVLK